VLRLVQSLKTNISQGNVATHSTCGGILFCKFLTESIVKEFSVIFLTHGVYVRIVFCFQFLHLKGISTTAALRCAALRFAAIVSDSER